MIDKRKDRKIKPGTRYNIIVKQKVASKLIRTGQKNHISVTKVIERLFEMAAIGKELTI
jgi:hypothetical protein